MQIAYTLVGIELYDVLHKNRLISRLATTTTQSYTLCPKKCHYFVLQL